jgi:hypothetical protein
MDTAELKSRIAAARHRLMTAENEMEAALHQIGRAPRADKTIISGALSTAFTELKAARQDLIDLEQAIASQE